MQSLPGSLSLWGKAQQMDEEEKEKAQKAQTQAAQLSCLAIGASPIPHPRP